MFNRSRRKIILSIMGSLILLFAVTITVIILASNSEMEQKYRDMLQRYVDIYSLEHPPGSLNDQATGEGLQQDSSLPQPPPDESLPEDGADYQLSTFYSVALTDDQTVLAIDDGEMDIYSEDELVAIAKDILAGGKSSGSREKLIYITAPKPGYTLVAFVDRTLYQSSMNTLERNVLIVGGAAILILLFVSFYLSKRIISPLEENDLRQRQFISDASHELKTPVAVIGTNAEMLRRQIGENEWLSNILYENERMGDLIRQLLDLSRAENTETAKEQLNFSRIVEGEILAFETFAYEHQKTIQSDVEADVQLTGDRAQLTRLVSVLLDNAVRHSTGSCIEIALQRQGQYAVLNVVNDCEEIPPERLKHLFDRFYRLDEVRNGEDQHYGLGLAIAKTAVENHGGTIKVSCHDKKILFIVSIPVKNQ